MSYWGAIYNQPTAPSPSITVTGDLRQGQLAQLTGSGWQAGETIIFNNLTGVLAGSLWDRFTSVADSNGSWAMPELAVPVSNTLTGSITATGSVSGAKTINLTTIAAGFKITLTPNSFDAGQVSGLSISQAGVDSDVVNSGTRTWSSNQTYSSALSGDDGSVNTAFPGGYGKATSKTLNNPNFANNNVWSASQFNPGIWRMQCTRNPTAPTAPTAITYANYETKLPAGGGAIVLPPNSGGSFTAKTVNSESGSNSGILSLAGATTFDFIFSLDNSSSILQWEQDRTDGGGNLLGSGFTLRLTITATSFNLIATSTINNNAGIFNSVAINPALVPNTKYHAIITRANANWLFYLINYDTGNIIVNTGTSFNTAFVSSGIFAKSFKYLNIGTAGNIKLLKHRVTSGNATGTLFTIMQEFGKYRCVSSGANIPQEFMFYGANVQNNVSPNGGGTYNATLTGSASRDPSSYAIVTKNGNAVFG